MQEEKHMQSEGDRTQAQKGSADEVSTRRAAHMGAVHTAKPKKGSAAKYREDPYLRPENEDDDGYDPFSDRPPEREPLFQRDPWA